MASKSLNAIAYDLLTTARGGQLADSELISINQVKFWVINTRALLIRQDQNKGRSTSENIVQVLPCVSLSTVSNSECCEISSNCTIKRTALAIPATIEVAQYDMLQRISGVDIMTPGISILPYQRAIYHGNSKWTADLPAAFHKNGYIYLLNVPANLTKISVQGVFENPTEAANFSTCSGTPCYSDDDEFPISAWMIEAMSNMILDKKVRFEATNPTDYTGDEKGAVQSQIIK